MYLDIGPRINHLKVKRLKEDRNLLLASRLKKLVII